MKTKTFVFTILIPSIYSITINRNTRALQKSHEKSQQEKWQIKFLPKKPTVDQTQSLVELVNNVANRYFKGCTIRVLYDEFTESSDELLLEKFFKTFQFAYVHGQITVEYRLKAENLIATQDTCVHYILFLKDVMRCRAIIGPQTHNKIVVVARSSQWRVYEYLANKESRDIVNLLVIAQSEKIVSKATELPFILYTHKLYTDALGSNVHRVLTSWKGKRFTRPDVNLFPEKMIEGFAGHRLIVSLAHEPPFVIKENYDDENENVVWNGVEVKLLELLSKMFNFTIEYHEAKNSEKLGASVAVTDQIVNKQANIGIGGIYVTESRMNSTDITYMHTQDCAAFITLTSTALPRYRAIMGPFHWSIWLGLTLVYLFAIFPLAFSDKHTLKHLIEKPEEIENMFWYVFGTFTNCFTFTGKNSWSKTDKIAPRLLIGFYWSFTIIVTACYSGSIIAFVTLPVYPNTVDTIEQLVKNRYQLGTLDKGGWEYWFKNSSDPNTEKLYKYIDLVPNVGFGLKNTTKAFFWPYAFMASKEQLNFLSVTNFTTNNKRSLLHISSNCFVPFSVSFVLSKDSIHSEAFSLGILKIVQSGLMLKIKRDIEFLKMRSSSGKLLAANSYKSSLKALTVEDRSLTLDDTQGMFLLLAIGFVLGGVILIWEFLGGFCKWCGRERSNSSSTIESNYRLFLSPTPREKLDSLIYNTLECRSNNNENSTHFDQNSTDNNGDLNPNNEKESTVGDDYDAEIDKMFDIFGERSNLQENIQ